MAVWMNSGVAPPLSGGVLRECELMGKRMDLPHGKVVVAPLMSRKFRNIRMSIATGEVTGEVKVYIFFPLVYNLFFLNFTICIV